MLSTTFDSRLVTEGYTQVIRVERTEESGMLKEEGGTHVTRWGSL